MIFLVIVFFTILVSLADCASPSPINASSSPSFEDYVLLSPLGSGGFGSTWFASRSGDGSLYVIKKLKRGDPSGLHERYFGEMFRRVPTAGSEHVGRFVDSFIRSDDMFLVSLYEGPSLFSLFYLKESNVIIDASAWSKWLRRTTQGELVMRNMIRQMLSGLSYIHGLGITHRDLKPANLVVCFYEDDGSCRTSDTYTEAVVDYIHL